MIVLLFLSQQRGDQSGSTCVLFVYSVSAKGGGSAAPVPPPPNPVNQRMLHNHTWVTHFLLQQSDLGLCSLQFHTGREGGPPLSLCLTTADTTTPGSPASPWTQRLTARASSITAAIRTRLSLSSWAITNAQVGHGRSGTDCSWKGNKTWHYHNSIIDDFVYFPLCSTQRSQPQGNLKGGTRSESKTRSIQTKSKKAGVF